MYSEGTNQAIAEVVGQPSPEQIVGRFDQAINDLNSQIQSIRDRAQNEIIALENRRASFQNSRDEVAQAHGLNQPTDGPVEG